MVSPMEYTLYTLLTVICVHSVQPDATSRTTSTRDIQEYCEHDGFKPNCGADEVILIKHARYGRMREGRCIPNAYGILGCSMDARHVLDRQCSGRRSCEIPRLSVIAQEHNSTCRRDLREYLEAAYDCVKVVQASRELCSSNRPLEVRAQHGYLSNLITQETGCGSQVNPWLVSVKPGQRLRMRFWNFFASSGGDVGVSTNVCHVYAVITETGARKSVCANTRRGGLVFTSAASEVEVGLVASSSREEADGYYLLEFEATGCPTPTPPTNGWVKRIGGEASIGCNDTGGETWALKCEDTRWIGEFHNCTAVSAAQGFVRFFKDFKGLSITILVGLAVCVGLCVLLCGIIYSGRHSKREDPQGEPTANSCEAQRRALQRSLLDSHACRHHFDQHGPHNGGARQQWSAARPPPVHNGSPSPLAPLMGRRATTAIRQGPLGDHSPTPGTSRAASDRHLGDEEQEEDVYECPHLLIDHDQCRLHGHDEQCEQSHDQSSVEYYELDPEYIAAKEMEERQRHNNEPS